ncbi:MAG: ABC transporter permease [Tannerella sp.]|jgi:putative ABC transport system permease protein|nr:ABC transporter permease [Tannerella sp.]
MDKYIQYFRQARNLLRQEKAFCAIYILGTGLSITVVMALLIVFHIKIANVYPETNRDRMLSVKRGMERSETTTSSGGISHTFIETCLKPLENAEAVTAVSAGEARVQSEGSRRSVAVKRLYTDEDFWTVFRFRFSEGKPYTAADVQSGIPVAVVARSLAQRLFGDAGAVGQYLIMNSRQYRICGVAEDASWIAANCYAQVWTPYSVDPDIAQGWGLSGFMGNMQAYILASSSAGVGKTKREIEDRFRRFAAQCTEAAPDLLGQPDIHWQSVFREGDNSIDFSRVVWQYGLVVFVLLLVPAVSLSGMADSRMERRLAEMGIRRAFGAPASTLMRQVLFENFLFTLPGGMAGLLFSWILVVASGRWIMNIGQSLTEIPPGDAAVGFTPTMLFNLPVFGLLLLVCFLLNLFSALIPAWRASRHQIVDSLNVN